MLTEDQLEESKRKLMAANPPIRHLTPEEIEWWEAMEKEAEFTEPMSIEEAIKFLHEP